LKKTFIQLSLMTSIIQYTINFLFNLKIVPVTIQNNSEHCHLQVLFLDLYFFMWLSHIFYMWRAKVFRQLLF